MLRPQKGNSRVLFNDTLINFRLRCTVCSVLSTMYVFKKYPNYFITHMEL